MPEHRHIAALIDAYLSSDYIIEPQGRGIVLQIGTTADHLRAVFPQAGHFGVITAWNPRSQPLSEAVNHAANAQLQQILSESGLTVVPTLAAATDALDRVWNEPGWLVIGMPQLAFDALARQFGQLAWLYWPADACVRLRVDAPQPTGYRDEIGIDWLK